MGNAAARWAPEERRLIKAFRNGSFLEFARRADQTEFEIFYVDSRGCRRSASRKEAYKHLRSLSDNFDRLQLFTRYREIARSTSAELDSRILRLISNWSNEYSPMALTFECVFTFLYAELSISLHGSDQLTSQRIQLLGVHHILIEERPASYALDFAQKVSKDRFLLECVVRGI